MNQIAADFADQPCLVVNFLVNWLVVLNCGTFVMCAAADGEGIVEKPVHSEGKEDVLPRGIN